MKLDRSKIVPPYLFISSCARIQLKLLRDTDYTITNKVFRLSVAGKGCSGFELSVYFGEKEPGDFCYKIHDTENLFIDVFTANYLDKVRLDFNRHDGIFVIENKTEKDYSGKFWSNDESLLPPVLSGS